MKYPDDFINKIIYRDCLEVMKEMPDGCVDLTITSPPYNLGNDHHTGSKRHEVYNDLMPENEYQKWQIDVLQEVYRITNSGGSLFYNHKNRIRNGVSIVPYEWLFETSWIIKQEIIWWNGSQNFDSIRFYPHTEKIYWLSKRTDTTLHNNTGLLDIWKILPVGTRYSHTRQFPEKVVCQILNCFPESKLILDPFIGAGTTARIAKDYNKDFIGIEINPDYCKIAEERLAQGVL